MNARVQPVAVAEAKANPFATHEVRNQARPALGFNAFDDDRALSGLIAKIAPWAREKLSALGAHAGCANPEVALEGLRGCTVGIEAEPDFRRDLELLATSIGCEPLALPPGVRALYHASAYYVGPFLIALLKEGVELWKSFGASKADALRAMMPLLWGTVAAVLDGGLANGMGGCVARGDVGTILKHLEALDERFPASGALYRELALRNVPLGIERGTLSSRHAAEIENLLLRPRCEEPEPSGSKSR